MKKSRIFLDNQDQCFNLARHEDVTVKYRSNPQAKVDSYTVCEIHTCSYFGDLN